MISTLIIVFREVLEASLVIGIALAAAKGIDGGRQWITAGIGSGVAVALIVAIFAKGIAAAMSGMGQEYFNATVLILTAALMMWTAIWMRRHGRELAGHIRQQCTEISDNGAPRLMLAIVVALAVAREGAEVVLFLYGIAAAQNEPLSMLGGGAAGLILGSAVAVALYRGLIRIQRLFSVITMLIVILAAGMASQGVAWLVMIDALPALGQSIWNSSGLIAEQSAAGQLLQVLIGYDDRPGGMQLLAFSAVLLTSWLAMTRQNRTGPRKTGVAALAIIACLLMQPTDSHARKVYSPIVEQEEVELEYLLDYSLDNSPVANGSARHQFELAYGITDRWMSAIVADYRKRPGQRFTYQGVKWENVLQLFEQGERWLDAGLYGEYIIPQKSLNKPDVIELKVLLEKEAGRLLHTLNMVLKRELGAIATNSTTAGYAWRSRWRWTRKIEPAIELYGSLGEIGNTAPLSQQTHLIGPVLQGKLAGGIEYEIGYLFGLTAASERGAIKFLLGYEF